MCALKEKLYGWRLEPLNDKGTLMLDSLQPIETAIGVAIGLIVVVAIYTIAPIIGSNIDASTTIAAASQWNSTTNTDLTTGVDLWTQNASLLALAIMVSILSLIIFSIMSIRGEQGE